MSDESKEVYKEAYQVLAASLAKSSTHHVWVDLHQRRKSTLGLITSDIPLIHAVHKSGNKIFGASHVVVVFEAGEVRIRNFESHPNGDISRWDLSDPECFSSLDKYFGVIDEAYPQVADPMDIIVCLIDEL